MTDSQHLLAQYVQYASEIAFRDLVTRYLDLVHSVALRRVGGDTHLAQDIAQTVFADLARTASTLPADVLLGGWLHRHTCFVAAHTLRRERRRQSRERQAVEMNALHHSPEDGLSGVAPILDEAINELAEADRTAIVLRFFEQRDFRAVGDALGSTEDAARMRVNRALEKLHGLLSRRGVASSTAALAAGLAANAVHAAPVGLAAIISGATSLGPTAFVATTGATKAIAMTTLQKTILGATLAAAVGSGVYLTRQASTSQAQVEALQREQARLTAQLEQLALERDAATSRWTALQEESGHQGRDTTELLRLRAEVTRLRALEPQRAPSGPAVQQDADPCYGLNCQARRSY